MAMLMAVVIVAGCTGSQTVTNTPTPTAVSTPLPTSKTITDDAGRTVTLPYNVTHYANPYPGSEYVYVMLGVENGEVAGNANIKSDSTLLQINPGVANESAPFTGGSNVNIEQLLAANPQVAILQATDSRDSQIINAGIPVVEMNNGASLQGFLDWVNLSGEVFGGNAQIKANQYVTYVNDEMANISSRVANIPADQRPTFVDDMLYLSSYGWLAEGNNSYDAQIMNECGGVNAVTENTSWFTEEQMLNFAQNATFICVDDQNTYNTIKNDSAWQTIPAVKNHRLYILPCGVFSSWDGANQQIALQILWNVKTMYPDQFQDINLPSAIKYFYPNFMRYNISDQEVNTMMANMVANNGSGNGQAINTTTSEWMTN
jgi:iron complex transport system substrate-binding protein